MTNAKFLSGERRTSKSTNMFATNQAREYFVGVALKLPLPPALAVASIISLVAMFTLSLIELHPPKKALPVTS